jgi:uncharacterized protein YrrD
MDRKATDIVGLPVVTLESGSVIYTVEDLILDTSRRQVLALLVREASLFHSARAIPFGRVKAIGPDAALVQNGKAVIEVDRDPLLRSLYNEKVLVRELRVLTDAGRKLGNVSDMLIDDRTGEIKGFNVTTGAVADAVMGMKWLPMDRVLGIGRRIVYVSADFAREFDAQAGGWLGALVLGKTAGSEVASDDGSVIVRSGQTVTPDVVETARAAGRLPQLLAAVDEHPASDAMGLLRRRAGKGLERARAQATGVSQWLSRLTGENEERATERRARFAVGRPVTRAILDADDNVILNAGDIITNHAIQAAREAGVLDVLLSSVYNERTTLSLEQMRIRAGDLPRSTPRGRASAESSRMARPTPIPDARDGAAPVPLNAPGEIDVRTPNVRAEAESGEMGDEAKERLIEGGYGPISES